eukprot:TRINITY_DN2137_c4_g1_i1.p1 TRINITY_DN2137_c4_g1~~TRINITY_DN2137_c4_g1_i1.p1  ORF type:complete len:139 (+),score=14.25 TRINITY_DN2137_c4_g1_i1:606-1022(+)
MSRRRSSTAKSIEQRDTWRRAVGYGRVAVVQIATQAFDLLEGLGMGSRGDEDALGSMIDTKSVERDVPTHERALCAVGCGCCLCTACLSWIPFCGASCSRTHNELSTIDTYDDTVPAEEIPSSRRSSTRRRSSNNVRY